MKFKPGDKVRSIVELFDMTASVLGVEVPATPPGEVGTVHNDPGVGLVVRFLDGSWTDLDPEWYELVGD